VDENSDSNVTDYPESTFLPEGRLNRSVCDVRLVLVPFVVEIFKGAAKDA